MRKDWLWIGVASLLLAACSTNDQQAPISSHSLPLTTDRWWKSAALSRVMNL